MSNQMEPLTRALTCDGCGVKVPYEAGDFLGDIYGSPFYCESCLEGHWKDEAENYPPPFSEKGGRMEQKIGLPGQDFLLLDIPSGRYQGMRYLIVRRRENPDGTVTVRLRLLGRIEIVAGVIPPPERGG